MIKSAIKSLSDTHKFQTVVYGQITNVDKSKQICDIIPSNGDAEIFDVRLQSTAENAVMFVPKDKSYGIALMESVNSGYLVWVEEAEICHFKIDETVFKLSGNGIEIKKGGADLKAVLLDFLKDYDDTLTLLTKPLFIAGQIPVTLLPTAIPTIVDKKTKLVALKNNINSIFK